MASFLPNLDMTLISSTIKHLGQTFVDWVSVHVKAGKGGDGCSHLLRTRSRKGGPDGGDGGKGGSIKVVADRNLSQLSHLKHQYVAVNGENGSHGRSHGKRGKTLALQVPTGSLIRDSASGNVIADLTDDGQELVLVSGGDGGYGNMAFKSSVNQAPLDATLGQDGEERSIEIELKSIADMGLITEERGRDQQNTVGALTIPRISRLKSEPAIEKLATSEPFFCVTEDNIFVLCVVALKTVQEVDIGFPNAGKSTLLRALSRAKPQVAAYPFTTLKPHIGMVEFPDTTQISDIPGLVKDAHRNKGLGHSFLRHVERCKSFLYVMDGTHEDILNQFMTLRDELELYKNGLSSVPSAIVLNKKDMLKTPIDDHLANFQKQVNLPLFLVSGKYHLNITELKLAIKEILSRRKLL